MIVLVPPIDQDTNVSTLEENIILSLEERKYEQAMFLGLQLKDNLPEVKNIWSTLNSNERIDFLLDIIARIFKGKEYPSVKFIDAYEFNRQYDDIDDELSDKTSGNKICLTYVISFLNTVEEILPQLYSLLDSTILTDFIESMNFFIAAYQFQLKGSLRAIEGIKKLLFIDYFNIIL